MSSCHRCGAATPTGRFCAECGAPVAISAGTDAADTTADTAASTAASTADTTADTARSAVPGDADDWRTGTAVRPAVSADLPPAVPAPASPGSPAGPAAPSAATAPAAEAEPPTTARYPLWADDPGTGDRREEAGAPTLLTAAAVLTAAGSAAARPPGAGPGRTARALPWLVGALFVVLLAGGGALLVLGVGSEDPAVPDATRGAGRAPERGPAPEPSPSGSPDGAPGVTPTGDPVEVAAAAAITVPATAPSSVDVADGSTTSYDDTRLVDGDPTTCWRTSGDASGSEIVLDLAEPVALSQVGLVNGYAKTATDPRGRTYDWYSLNRRVLVVEWVLDDGTTLRQDLGEARGLQTLDAGGVVTSSVRLRIVEVSAPGDGPDAKDYTALSEVSLLGAPVAAG